MPTGLMALPRGGADAPEALSGSDGDAATARLAKTGFGSMSLSMTRLNVGNSRQSRRPVPSRSVRPSVRLPAPVSSDLRDVRLRLHPEGTAIAMTSGPSTAVEANAKVEAKDGKALASSSNQLSQPSRAAPSSSGHRVTNASYFFPDPLALRLTPPVPRGRPYGTAAKRSAILWFRSDLRLHDNEALAAAQRDATSVVPVFCFDPRDYGKSKSGFQRTGPYRAQFLLECVADLRRGLKDVGSELVVRVGHPEKVIAELVRAASADLVVCHSEVTTEEMNVQHRVEEAVKGEGAQMRCVWGSTLYHKDDLPSKSIPSNYGGFRQMVKDVKIRKTIDKPRRMKGLPIGSNLDPGTIPSLSQLGIVDDKAKVRQVTPAGAPLIGGETEAMQQMKAFLKEIAASTQSNQPKKKTEAGAPARQAGTSNPSFSCKISPWLALGCLSPRLLYEKVSALGKGGRNKEQGQATQQKTGLSWLVFELMWRDFFRFTTNKHSAIKSPATTKASQAQPSGAVAS